MGILEPKPLSDAATDPSLSACSPPENLPNKSKKKPKNLGPPCESAHVPSTVVLPECNKNETWKRVPKLWSVALVECWIWALNLRLEKFVDRCDERDRL